MIDAKNLLDRFLGSGLGAGLGSGLGSLTGQNQARPPATRPDAASPWTNPTGSGPAGSGGIPLGNNLGGLADAARQALGGLSGSISGGRGGGGGYGGLAAGGAAGGLLGLLLGGRKKGKGRINSTLTHGGAALLGALAQTAYQNWQGQRSQGGAAAAPAAGAPATLAQLPPPEAVEARFRPDAAPAADGSPFELALIRAMVAAAKADGHVDEAEHRRILGQVGEMELDAEARAFVFDALAETVGVSQIAAAASTPEQAAELYLASCLAIDPEQAEERAYLDALALRLRLPEGLPAHLRQQAAALREA